MLICADLLLCLLDLLFFEVSQLGKVLRQLLDLVVRRRRVLLVRSVTVRAVVAQSNGLPHDLLERLLENSMGRRESNVPFLDN